MKHTDFRCWDYKVECDKNSKKKMKISLLLTTITINTGRTESTLEAFTDVPIEAEYARQLETFTDEPDGLPNPPDNVTIGDCVIVGNSDECTDTSTCVSTTTGPKCVCSEYYEAVDNQCTPINSDWSLWTGCSLTCGGGRRSRTRTTAGISEEQTGGCNTESCPIATDQLEPCSCDDGMFKCEDKSVCGQGEHCQRHSLTSEATSCFEDSLGACSAYGDPHIQTFDGQWLDVYGLGTYVFAQIEEFEVAVNADYFEPIAAVNGYDKIKIEVLMTTFKCGTVSCADSFTTTDLGF